MAGTYVDNWSNKYATNQWVWWTERDAIGIAKYDEGNTKFKKIMKNLNLDLVREN